LATSDGYEQLEDSDATLQRSALAVEVVCRYSGVETNNPYSAKIIKNQYTNKHINISIVSFFRERMMPGTLVIIH
jgi:hypothetical protein